MVSNPKCVSFCEIFQLPSEPHKLPALAAYRLCLELLQELLAQEPFMPVPSAAIT